MSDAWYPGAVRRPGAAAGYQLTYDRPDGQNRMEVVKCHYTVGVDSTPIGDSGHFQFLVGRDGAVTQFAEVGAYCMDSGEWNDAGPGVEIEYHPAHDPEIFTNAARVACGSLVLWLHTEHGFPLAHHSTPRIQEFGGFRGFIDHGALLQSESHYDYWPADDWALMIGMTRAQEDGMYVVVSVRDAAKNEVALHSILDGVLRDEPYEVFGANDQPRGKDAYATMKVAEWDGAYAKQNTPDAPGGGGEVNVKVTAEVL